MATKNITDIQVVKAYIKNKVGAYEHERWPYHILSLETRECEKVCYRAMERAERRGLIECGVSLRSGWVTEKGFELLKKGGTL